MLLFKLEYKLNKIIQILLFSLIALQPLHSYTVINTSSAPEDNGFHLLHADLCGSKYTSSISHTKKLSDLLDRINSALLSSMPEDCVCCNSIYINSIDIFTVQYQHTIFVIYDNPIQESYYDSNIKSHIRYTNESRAPPLV